MMTEIYPDIPRVYTAIAEVTACVVFAFMLKKPKEGVKNLVSLESKSF